MYLVWNKYKDGLLYFHLISTSFYVLIHAIGYGGLALFSLVFIFTIFLPNSIGGETKLTVAFVLLVFFIYLALIHVGKELVIDQEAKRIGKVHSNMLKNMYWGTPTISWRIIDNNSELHLQRLYQPGDEEVPGITTWKLISKGNGEDLVLLDTEGEQFMDIMTEIACKIARTFTILYIDQTTEKEIILKEPLFLPMGTDTENITSGGYNSLENITGLEYNPEYYTLGYRLFAVAGAIFLAIGLSNQKMMTLFFSLGIISLVFAGFIYNNSDIVDKITMKDGTLIVSKQSRIYSIRKESIALSEILTIQHSAFAGRDFVEIIGYTKRFALFGNYIQPEADQMIKKITDLIAENDKE